jgi:hypothetical protein
MLLQSADNPGLRSGLSSLFKTLLQLFHPGGPQFLSWILVLLIAFAGIVCTLILAKTLSTHKEPHVGIPFLAVALLLPVSAAMISIRSSHILLIQSRYLLPIWPAVAVLVGVCYNTIHNRLGCRVSTLFLASLLIPQAAVFSYFVQSEKEFAVQNRQARGLASIVDQLGIEALYGSYWDTWMNYATDDKSRIAVLSSERHALREQQALLADRIGFLDGAGNIGSFLVSTKASASHALDGRILYDLQPPPPTVEPIIGDYTATLITHSQHHGLPEVHDMNIDTGIQISHEPSEYSTTLELVFPESKMLNGMVFWWGRWNPPTRIGIDAFHEESETWKTVLPAAPVSSLFWSGPRIFIGGLHQRTEFRWAGFEASRWRISFPVLGEQIGIAELVCLRETTTTETHPDAAWKELGHFLQTRGITRIYADRWLSQKLAFGEFQLAAELDDAFSRTVHALPILHTRRQPVRLTPTTGMIAETTNADMCRVLLNQKGIQPVEEIFQAWTVFHFRQDGVWNESYRGAHLLRWMGPYCLLAEAPDLTPDTDDDRR